MSQLGIFAKTFQRGSLEEVCGAVVDHGYSSIQFNLSSAGLATLPQALDASTLDWIGGCLDAYELSVAAVSGTFNMAHPDSRYRENGLAGLEVIARHCAHLGTSIITLCTGTRDAEDMWRAHPENGSASAWQDLVETLRRALEIAEHHDVTLAFEPEQGNVVNSAEKARQLMDALGKSDYLRVILDPANLLEARDLARQREVVDRAVDLLGRDIVLVHAKDMEASGKSGATVPGHGVIDFGAFFKKLAEAGFEGPVITHGFPESGAGRARTFLTEQLRKGAGKAA